MFAVLPAPVGQPGGDLLRPRDSRPLRADPGDVQRYLQPRAGEPGRRAHDPRLRAGEGRDAPLRGIEPRVHRAEHPPGARAGPVRAAAGSADRPDLPGGAVGGRPPGAGRPHLRRQLRHVQHLHGHAGVAHDRARLGGQPDAARQRVAASASTTFCTSSRRSPRRPTPVRLGAVRGEIEFRQRDGGLRQRSAR